MSRRRLSVSAVGKYLECPRAFDYAYMQRLPRPESEVPEAWRIGSVVHKGMEVGYLAAKEAEHSGSLEPFAPVAMAATRAEWERLELPARGGGLDRALEMVSETLRRVVEHHENILGVEAKFFGSTSAGTPFIGFGDLIRRASRDTLEIRDYKVRAKVSSPEDLAHDFQGSLYAHFALRDNKWAKRVVFSHLYPNHNVKLVSVELTSDAIAEAVEKLDAVGEMIHSDEEYAPRPGDHCGFCAYTDVCPAWEKQRSDDTFKEMADF